MFEAFEKELEKLRRLHLYRELKSLSPLKRPIEVEWRNERYVTFSSNDYLGLSVHPALIKKAQAVLQEEGVGSGASRLISGSRIWHQRLEEKIAAFKKKPAALVFSTGFMTNLGTITALMNKKSLIVCDKLNHASIIDACHLSKATVRVYPHQSLKKLETLLQGAHRFERTLIVTDSVFSMDGDIAFLHEIVALKKKYNAMLMVDEAHATGIFGTHGGGVVEMYDLDKDVEIQMGTLSKAIGTLGGFVAADKAVIEYLINRSRAFIYTTALPSHICAAACEAIDIIMHDDTLRPRLRRYASQIRQALQEFGFSVGGETESPIIPVIIGDEERTLNYAERLLAEGFYVPAVRTPTVPKGKARLRITVSAAHTEVEIDRLIDFFKRNEA